jgi:hypothetical protein
LTRKEKEKQPETKDAKTTKLNSKKQHTKHHTNRKKKTIEVQKQGQLPSIPQTKYQNQLRMVRKTRNSLRHTLYDFSAATNAGSRITASHAGPMTTIGRTLPPSYLVIAPLDSTGAELLTVCVSVGGGRSEQWWQIEEAVGAVWLREQ